MTDRPFIEVHGARENNLRNVSLNIPKHQITVFTGVSGSGKSSLVFDTIAAEAQRQLNETFTAFVQGFLPHYGQPDVDSIEHLNAPIIIDQKRVGGGSRSTVGTYTDIAAVLRLLFSRVGQPSAGPAALAPRSANPSLQPSRTASRPFDRESPCPRARISVSRTSPPPLQGDLPRRQKPSHGHVRRSP